MKAAPHTLCPLCGGANKCQPAQAGHFDVTCWCMAVVVCQDALAQVKVEQGAESCLCPGCAAGMQAQAVKADADGM